jgi:hypothetical protein
MALSITNIVIHDVFIDYVNQFVRITFSLADDSGRQWSTEHAIFWVTLPANPTDYDFQLPSGYITSLVNMKASATTAIANRFLGA